MANHPASRAAAPVRPRRPPRCSALLCWALCLGVGLADAAESRIELRDGSTIAGEVVGVGNGVYRVRSAALGEITVRESEVLAIRPLGADAAAPSGTAVPTSAAAPSPFAGAGPQAGDLAAIQQQLLGNPQTMEAITRLQSDPGIQAALADPQFVALIMSGNVEALRADPRFAQLMENPLIRDLVGQVLGR